MHAYGKTKNDSQRLKISVVVVIISLLLFFGWIAYFSPWVMDDSFISARYAKNLVEGNGLVFNPGERVEGYTNFLWVMLMALVVVAGWDPILFAQIAGTIFGICAMFLSISLARKAFPGSGLWTCFGLLWLTASGSWAVASMSGMETALFALLAMFGVGVMAVEAEHHELRGSGIIFGLAYLTRPEGALVFAAAWLATLVWSLRDKRRLRISYQLSNGVFFALIFGAHLAFRWFYYHELLPNTWYAKAGGLLTIDRGAGYLASFLFCHPEIVLIFCAFWFAPLTIRRLLYFTPAIAYCAYAIYIGGDSLPGFRFAGLPLMLFISLTPAVSRIPRRKAIIFLCVAIVLWNFAISFHHDMIEGVKKDAVARYGKAMGKFLAYEFPPGTLIAANTAGSVPYYSNLPTIDMLGLNDKTIARTRSPIEGRGWVGHEKGNGRYVLDRKPKVIIFGSSHGMSVPYFPSDFQIDQDPRFHACYESRSVNIDNRPYFFFVRTCD